MISNIWIQNIEENLNIVQKNHGPSVFVAVTGNETDNLYWKDHFENLRGDLFRRDRTTTIISVAETSRKGNFLGTLNAWAETKKILAANETSLPNVILVNMIFGQGKRFAPFTQALGNRKSAFPLPFNSNSDGNGSFLCTADLSCLYTNLWIDQLTMRNFKGVVVKWGDEAVIPGRILMDYQSSFSGIDGVRFIWKRHLTEELARDKEWVLVEDSTNVVKKQFARSNLSNLKKNLSDLPEGVQGIGVNLGSLAVSYDFLDAGVEVFAEDINDTSKWVDWDPYIWIAFHCESEDQWLGVLENERENSLSGLSDLVERYPNLYEKICEVKRILMEKNGRPFSVQAFDFGEPYWADFGLHHSLRRQLASLVDNSIAGSVSRKLFQIPEETDENGNRIIRSSIPLQADIRDSVILDSIITDPDTRIRQGLVVGGVHGKITMLKGGSALFCVVDKLEFDGPHGIAFGSVGRSFSIAEGGRHTSLLAHSQIKHLIGNESVIDLKGDNYEKVILGNDMSFADAEKLMSEVNPKDIEIMRDKIRKFGRKLWAR